MLNVESVPYPLKILRNKPYY